MDSGLSARRGSGLAIAVIAAAVALGGCLGAGEVDDLSGLNFASTEVVKEGKPVGLVPHSRLEVFFPEGGDDRTLTWMACNFFSGEASVTSTQIEWDLSGSTEKGCPGPLARQDEWLVDFFSGDPSWRLEGDELTLTADETVIRLREKTGP